MGCFQLRNGRLREVKGLAKVTQGHRMGLSEAACPGGSELPGTLTALHLHSQSRAHARVQAHTHSHMHTGTCAHRQKARTLTLVLTHAPHTCALTRTGERGHAQLHTHSCPTCAGTPVHPHTHVSTEGSHTCIYGHPHVHTHQSAHTGVHTSHHPRPGGRALGTPVGVQPLGHWPPRASARAGLPPSNPSTPVTLFAIKSLTLRQEKIAPF